MRKGFYLALSRVCGQLFSLSFSIRAWVLAEKSAVLLWENSLQRPRQGWGDEGVCEKALHLRRSLGHSWTVNCKVWTRRKF